ncbi:MULTISPECIES: hypothetical protein [unclassified Roseibium]|uniref:hypothetical protein n=1 Tax=unclassified Roseibium TaxID=2629323 RepID=UPI00317A233F
MQLPLSDKRYGVPGIAWMWVQKTGEIDVYHGHSLSYYSKAIYGNFSHINEFYRPGENGGLQEIVNKDLIRIGEKIIWKPQYDYYIEMNGPRSGTSVTLPPDQAPFFTGAEIIAIETTYSWDDAAGLLETVTTFGEVQFNSMPTFVDGVLSALGTRSLSVLHVQVHGSSEGSGIDFGSHDMLREGTFHNYEPLLRKLAGRFRADGWVFFRACFGGQYHVLMRQIRDLWQCNVISGVNWQSNWLPLQGGDFNQGAYYVVKANGEEYTTQMLPGSLRHLTGRRLIRWATGE